LEESGYVGADAEKLTELSARICTATSAKTDADQGDQLLRRLLEMGHGSVLEHATATFLITDVSRALSHELVRHRHFSYSQLSQRYFDHREASFILPPLLAADDEISKECSKAYEEAAAAYRRLLDKLSDTGVKARHLRSAARYLLPNGTATAIVVTGNMRAFRHFLRLRGSEAADVEIRLLAVEILKQLRGVAPRLFADFEVYAASDGFPAIKGGLPA